MTAWNARGREVAFDRLEISMSHEELVNSLPREAVERIDLAGFVLVPKSWRERVFKVLSNWKPSCGDKE